MEKKKKGKKKITRTLMPLFRSRKAEISGRSVSQQSSILRCLNSLKKKKTKTKCTEVGIRNFSALKTRRLLLESFTAVGREEVCNLEKPTGSSTAIQQPELP